MLSSPAIPSPLQSWSKLLLELFVIHMTVIYWPAEYKSCVVREASTQFQRKVQEARQGASEVWVHEVVRTNSEMQWISRKLKMSGI